MDWRTHWESSRLWRWVIQVQISQETLDVSRLKVCLVDGHQLARNPYQVRFPAEYPQPPYNWLKLTKNINNILINSIGTVNFLTNAAEETFFRLDDDVEFIKLGRLLSSDDPKATDDDDNEGDGDNVNLIFGVITDCIRHGLRNTWRKNISSIPGCRTK